jgi:8-oxo-dGTP pyrophosphatase MutT (NUDIX family)
VVRPRHTTTWDGKPISPEAPFGATVVVYRLHQGQAEFLILHRSIEGAEYEGDWAWTPPSGARYPGEEIDDCAARELKEETGLELPLRRTGYGEVEWAIYVAEAELTGNVQLGAEHDRCEWVPAQEAERRCLPEEVGRPFRLVSESLSGA